MEAKEKTQAKGSMSQSDLVDILESTRLQARWKTLITTRRSDGEMEIRIGPASASVDAEVEVTTTKGRGNRDADEEDADEVTSMRLNGRSRRLGERFWGWQVEKEFF